MKPSTTIDLEHSDGPCVIYHPTFGIYLATLIGDWWSAIDPCGSETATAFKDRDEVRTFIQSRLSEPGYAPCRALPEGEDTIIETDNNPTHYRIVRVVPDCDPGASPAACEAVGLPPWTL